MLQAALCQSEKVPGHVESLCHIWHFEISARREGIFQSGVRPNYLSLLDICSSVGVPVTAVKQRGGDKYIGLQFQEVDKICIRIMTRDAISCWLFRMPLVNCACSIRTQSPCRAWDFIRLPVVYLRRGFHHKS